MLSLARVRSALSRLRGVARFGPQNKPAYDGATTGRRSKGWFAPNLGPNEATLPNIDTLRARARDAVRNDAIAKRGQSSLVGNIIGKGIRPLPQSPDVEFRRGVRKLWDRWVLQADADGLLDFYGLQALAVRAWLEGGEVFARLRSRRPEDGLAVPLQIQLIEPELCPVTYTATNGANRIRAGVEFSPIGQRAAYWMYRQRPGDLQDIDTSQLVRVPAETVLPLFDPLRPGQIRGVPHLTQMLLKLHDLDKFDDATLLRQQISNLFVLFLKRAPYAMTNANGEPIDPLTGEVIDRDDNDRAMMALEPATIQELTDKEDIKWSDPPGVAATYAEFMRQQMLAVAAGVDVPYEILTGDLSRVNDRTVRIILHEFRRRLEQWQDLIVMKMFLRPVWNAWWDRALISGAIIPPPEYFDDPEAWRSVNWVPQRWPYLHPVQDVEADIKAVRAGFKSRRDVAAELGDNVEEIDDEIAADNQRADDLGLKFDSDGRNPAGGGKAATTDDDADPAPAPTPAPAPVPEPRRRREGE